MFKKYITVSLLFLFFLISGSTAADINAALAANGGTASQSSTDYAGAPERAIDGNTDGNFNNGSVSHTGNSTRYEWWQVDLGSVQKINTIDLYNRTDCCGYRLKNVNVMVSDQPFNPDTTYTSLDSSKTMSAWRGQVGSSPGDHESFTVGGVDGQYILIQKEDSLTTLGDDKCLSLAEVEVWVDGPEADLKVSEISPPTPDPVNVNEEVTFTVRVNNLGPDDATGTKTLTVTYDQPVTIVSATQTSGGGDFICTISGTTITCTKTNQLNSGAVNKDFEFVVKPSNVGILTQTATITTDTTSDPDTANNTLASQVVVDSDCHGCNCSLDDDTQNSTSPGVTIPALDHASTDVSTCLSGTSDGTIDNIQADYYNFIVDTDGAFSIRTTSPNGHDFHLRIEVNGNEVYPDQTSQSHAFDANLSSGDQVVLYFKETGDDLDEYEANLTFTSNADNTDFTCSHPHKFITRFNEYISGDLVAIGNSNICADVDPNDTTQHGDGVCDANQLRRNDTTNVIHINRWSSTNTDINGLPDAQASTLLNVTNAELNLPPGAKVKWAGLYWQGSVWNFKKGIIINAHGVDSGDDGEKMMAKEMEVSFMRPADTDFMSLKADELYWFNLYREQLWGGEGQSWGYGYGDHFGYTDEHYFYYRGIKRYEQHYQGFKDVTSLLQDVEAQTGSANGKYWVGNIQATVGLLGYPGAEAAWTLQVVYDLPNAQPRVITVTDGYVGLYGSAFQGDDYANENNCPTGAENTGVYAYEVNFDIDNILTPKKKADFATDMTLFATESDPDSQCATDSLPEQLTLTKKDGSIYVVDGNPAALPGANPRNTCDAWHYSITKKDGSDNLDRNPNDIYPIGMTLRNYHMTDALSTDQNSTHITFKTDTDRLILGVIGFATDMNAPELCYDYDIRIGDYINLPSTDRNFTAQKWGDKDLQVKVLIRSKEADFDFENAKLRLTFTPSDVFSYRIGDSEISPEGINAYLPAVETDSARGEIAIGHDFGSDGGILGPEESTYIKQKFTFLKSDFAGKFDIFVDGNVSYIPGRPPVGYHLSTAIPEDQPGYIDRCPTNPVYDPIWGQFNIENTIADPSDPAEERYPLYTQVAGHPYSVNVVNYIKNPSTGAYDTKSPIHATVELELIDVSPFDNNASAGYDSTCQEPVAASKGAFIQFDNEESITVTPTDTTKFPDYDSQLVLRNAAFRIWMLTRDAGNGTRALVDHNCSSSADSGCFDLLYANVYEHAEDNTTQYCTADCDNSTGTTCYDCLRTYFARPICSRDNFAIRPEGFRVHINDTDEQNTSTPSNLLTDNTTNVQEVNLSAGYRYQLKVEATAFGNQNEFGDTPYRSKAYYTRFKIPQTVNPLPSTVNQAVLLDFNDSTSCADTNNSAMNLVMYDSTTPSDDAAFVHSNAGHYSFWMFDSDWTQVDQISYEYKRTFDPACTAGSTNTDECSECLVNGDTSIPNTGKVGCTISSRIADNDHYRTIPLLFQPYRFDTSSVQLSLVPPTYRGYLFMNDFTSDYYADPVSDPIDMGAIFAGNIIALGKDNAQLTNFTDSCAAANVRLNLYMGDFNGTMQEYLQHTSSTNTYDDNQSNLNNSEVNLTLPKEAFLDASGGNTTTAGSAYIRISTTIQKPQRTDIASGADGLNPIKLLYKKLVATGDGSPSKADTANDPSHIHIPKGETDYNQTVTFLYGKITPQKRFYDKVQEDEKVTPLFVDVYCDKGDTLCASEYNLTTKSQGENENSDVWYWVEDRFAMPGGGNGLGTTNLVSSVVSSHPVPHYVETNDTTKAATINDIPFEDDATRSDVVVSVDGGTYRPVIVKVCYEPVPWLIYDPCDPSDPSNPGKDYYRVRFIGKSNWAGVGPTGHVVKTHSSNEGKSRMNW